jgi:Spy/CpxP family protein refolding chaperone
VPAVAGLEGENEMTESPSSDPTRPRGTRWLLAAASLVLVAGVLALVLGAASLAPGLAGAHPFGRWHHAGDADDHAALIEFWVDRMLDRIDASDEQRERVRAVIERLEPQVETMHGGRGELHRSFVLLFTAPVVDAAEVERLRAEQIGRFDRLSREIAGALTEIGAILTQEQRQQLAEMHSHHRGD